NEHHACRASCAAADHVLVGSADIGRNHFEDHAVLDLAASRILELRIGNVLDLDFPWFSVDDATIFAHDKPLLQWSGELSRFSAVQRRPAESARGTRRES